MASSLNTTSGVPLPPTPAQRQTALDAGIWYSLCLWPALQVAVQNGWGGPESADKRDWFAGEVSNLLSQRANTDHDDLVVFLLQVMQDEFECNVEDDSEEEVARGILGLQKRLREQADLGIVKELERRWKNMGKVKVELQEDPQDSEEDDWDDEEDVDGGIQFDEPFCKAPELVPARPRENPKPEIDEDGFQKVVTNKKR